MAIECGGCGGCGVVVVVGCGGLVVVGWLLVVGCWLLVVGCWLLVVVRTLCLYDVSVHAHSCLQQIMVPSHLGVRLPALCLCTGPYEASCLMQKSPTCTPGRRSPCQ